ncbi:hypothetical protein PHYSODRAFT_525977 [Phytophthora sojae]|uniref:Uncharacterized protein n=1 Tax=Phytophthora sojae (strain P6497) TaxID=1094619 RepID=G5A820_PHYSP|nr:hypothetical protein PHYSODRAFT_525977 [Phytophthora sojae]EGZ08046.1 hypothetical protein PHYSODRAFT_525977 [Phytophthora sojae]|eukprot:XP_009536218.1 hypothetical protein PHYSODRAFT_525977 [Phytophthora sojae]
MAGATKATETAAGKATFSSQRGAVFRFSVTPTRIWLEQQATKQQWQCSVSSVNDFALKGAGIPHAIVMDYLAMSLARSEPSRDTDYEVDLIAMSEGRMRLDFLLKFSIADVVWKPEYQFVLQPIEVTETQMLTAKLRDANDNLERLHAIVPAWVVGTQSWLYLCTLTKRVLDHSGTHVEAVVEWSTAAAHKTTDVVMKYWWVVRDTAAQAGGMVRQLVLDQYAATTDK